MRATESDRERGRARDSEQTIVSERERQPVIVHVHEREDGREKERGRKRERGRGRETKRARKSERGRNGARESKKGPEGLSERERTRVCARVRARKSDRVRACEEGLGSCAHDKEKCYVLTYLNMARFSCLSSCVRVCSHTHK